MFKWITSELCRDIQAVLVAATLAFIGIGKVAFDTLGWTPAFFTFLSVLTTAFLSLFVFFTNTGNTRTGVATVFASEIRNICNVMWSFGLASLSKESVIHNWQRLKEHMTSREEDYVETFSRNVDKLATLPDRIVFDITAFFTFLKASRDAVLVLNHWDQTKSDERKIEDVQRIANHLYHCLARARSVIPLLGNSRNDSDIQRIDTMMEKLKEFLGNQLVVLEEPLTSRVTPAPGSD